MLPASVLAVLVLAAIVLTTALVCAKGGKKGGFVLPKFGNGDAKFFGDGIITSVYSRLTMLDMNGNVTKDYGVSSNWIDGIPEEGIIICGSFENKTEVLKLDENNDIAEQIPFPQGDVLFIDPTINRIDGRYYATVTEIEGSVNNASPDVENGFYTIHMFVSDDYKHWEPLSDIAFEQANLEDVDIRYSGGTIYACYEKEVVDKGDSSIVVKTSVDHGKTWSEAVTLLEADCDHEPVSFLPDGDGYRLYYSCDKDDRGGSYMSGKIYYARFDGDFHCLEMDIRIKTDTDEGILWYDYDESGGQARYLFAGNYLTDNDMIVEVRPLKRAP